MVTKYESYNTMLSIAKRNTEKKNRDRQQYIFADFLKRLLNSMKKGRQQQF